MKQVAFQIFIALKRKKAAPLAAIAAVFLQILEVIPTAMVLSTTARHDNNKKSERKTTDTLYSSSSFVCACAVTSNPSPQEFGSARVW